VEICPYTGFHTMARDSMPSRAATRRRWCTRAAALCTLGLAPAAATSGGLAAFSTIQGPARGMPATTGISTRAHLGASAPPVHQQPQAGSPSSQSGFALLAGLAAAIVGLSRPRSTTPRTGPSALRAEMQPSLPDAGIAILDKEKVDRQEKMKSEFDKEKWWRVLLHNDDIHTFEYVTGCLTKVVKHLTRRKAYKITWEAHSSGKATVACVWKKLAEQFCVNLQQLGLTVSIAPDSKFEGSKGNQ